MMKETYRAAVMICCLGIKQENMPRTLKKMGTLVGLSFLAIVLAGVSGLQAAPYGVAGCGLGSVIMGKDDNQVFALFTNATSGQATSISSATSNCEDEHNPVSLMRQKNFVAVNYNFLKQEMASGKGEKLEAFAAILGCPTSALFASMAQKNHGYFFDADRQQTGEFVARVKEKIKKNDSLLSACIAQV